MTHHTSRREFLQSTPAAIAAGALVAGATSVSADKNQELIGKTPHTKFAANVEMWWTRLPFLDRIRQSAALGFPAVEFWPYQGKDIDAIAKLCRKLKIDIAQFTAWGFTPGLNHPKNEDAFVKRIEEACQVAHRLNCKMMTVVAGNNQKGMTKKKMHDQVVKALKRVVPIIEREKVMLILEPMNGRVDHPGHCLYGSPEAIDICRRVDSDYVKINWDLYHMQITEGDLCGRLREGIKHVGYLQLADHPGRNEPGTGEIHYNRVLKEAQALGYHGYVGLECRPKKDELTAAKGVAAADLW